MKLTVIAASLALALGGGYALADTAHSEQDRATMEHKASPSNDTKQDEERTEAHSQPDTPASTGGSSSAESAKPTHGDNYQSQENKADASKKPDSTNASPSGTPDNPTGATLPRSVR